MTPRQRFIATLNFDTPDRIPFAPGWGRRSTRENWHRQGLPDDGHDVMHHVQRELGMQLDTPQQPHVHHGVKFTMIPEFQEKVIERRSDSQIVQDWKGNVCEIGLEFSPSDLRGAPDFVTRSWLRCPVETHADWDAMTQRYNPDDPARWPSDFDTRAAQLAGRDYVSTVSLSGPFWQLREWLGFEPLCIAMAEDPKWVDAMAAFWQQFVSDVFDRLFAQHVPDHVMINEDMAYKAHAMISPAMVERFCMPAWSAWAAQCKAAGVAIYEVDSDGYVGELIRQWIEAGFTCNSPQEVAAGNDLPAFRTTFGRGMAYRGGVDKRAIAAGGRAIRNEIDRLRPVIESGGYIPGCDHGVPSDVTWPNFLDYCRLLAEATGNV